MRNKRGMALIHLGLVFIAAALFLVVHNMFDDYWAGRASRMAMNALELKIPERDAQGQLLPAGESVVYLPDGNGGFVPFSTPVPEFEMLDTSSALLPAMPEFERAIDTLRVEIPDYVLNPKMDMPVITQDGQDYIGVLEIPALELELPVISQWNYPRLRKAPCRYVGSAYTKDLVISAHNYDRHFGRLNTLQEGDRVYFTDADGNRFVYEVSLLETLKPRPASAMTEGEWDLTLFTCTVGGSYRVTARCRLVQDLW